MIDPSEQLKAYLDNELAQEDAELMRLALLNDPVLAKEADQLRAISATLAQATTEQPVGLESTLAALRRHRAWWRQPSIAWPAALSIAGATAMAIFLTTVLMPAGHVAGLRTAKFSATSESAFAGETKSDVEKRVYLDQGAITKSGQSNGMAKSNGRPPLQPATPLAAGDMANGVLKPRAMPLGKSSSAIALHSAAEVNDLLAELARQPGFVSISRDTRSLSNEMGVTVVYRNSSEKMKTLVARRSTAATFDGGGFGGKSFRLVIRFVPARP